MGHRGEEATGGPRPVSIRRWIELVAVGVLATMAVAVGILLPERLPPVLVTLVLSFIVLEAALILVLPESESPPPEPDETDDDTKPDP